MSTIPASQLVQVLPSVLNAGGASLEMTGLVLTRNTRVPIGSILSFPTALSVGSYFGDNSAEETGAQVYFNGFSISLAKPAALLFAQYNDMDVAAYLRSGNVGSALTLTQLQALSGSLTITIDGVARVASSINLSGATSYSAAAALIASGLNGALGNSASFTGAIAPSTASFTAVIDGDEMTVSGAVTGNIVDGAVISGTGVTSGTQVETQVSGTPGGDGVYAVSKTQVVASTTITATYGTLTVSAVASGTLSVGQVVAGSTTLANTIITALGTGIGLAGTYFVNLTQTVASSSSLTAGPVPCTASYDSVSGGFVIDSAIVGPASNIGFATGSLAAALLLTAATGAVTSQGAAAATPNAFMNNIIRQTTNWASFMTAFDPDGGVGCTIKLEFAAWNNAQNNEFAYIAWDTDIVPTENDADTSSFGYQVNTTFNYSGTFVIWEPTDLSLAWFALSYAPSLNFSAQNGRTTFAFRNQSGLVASVTDPTVAANLKANSYNFYGAYATASQNFIGINPGSVSGPFQWFDSYINQINLNAALQEALVNLLFQSNSIPYNAAGYAMIEAAMLDPINAALNFGSIRTGVPLSDEQAAQVTSATNAGVPAVLFTQGFYIQILPATAQVREARTSPPITLYYMDGGSCQQITLASILIQ